MKIENGNKNETKKDEKKKSNKGLKIFLAIFIPLFLVIILPVGLLYAFFFDTSKNEFSPDPNYNPDQEISNLALRAFDNTGSTGKIDVNLSLDSINNMVYKAMGKDLENSKIYNTSFSISGNDYILSASIGVASPVFTTRVYLILNVAHEESESDESIVMTLKSIKLGRLGGLESLALSLLSSAINDNSIEQMFSSLGMTAHSDLSNRKITLVKSELIQNIKKMLADQTDASIFGAMIDNFVEFDLINISHNDNTALDVSIDLTSLHNVSTYEDETKEEGYPILAPKDKTVAALNANIVDLAHADYAFDYFYYGYDRVNSDVKAYIDTLDLSSLEITDKTTYKGYGEELTTDKSIEEKLMESADPLAIATTGEIANISENILDDSFLGEDLIGYSYSFSGEDNGVKKYNVITLDNFYSNIVNDHIYFVGSISINGYRTKVAIDAVDKHLGNDDYKLVLGIEKAYYGANEACEAFKNSLFDLIGETVTSNWFSIDKNAKTLTLDFSNGISPTVRAAIEARGGAEISLKGDNISSEGFITLKTKN